MSSVALGLVASLVDSTSGLKDYVRLGLGAELFKGPDETSLWNLLHSYVQKYGAIPPRIRFQEVGIVLPLEHPDPCDYYADGLKQRYTHQVIKQATLDLSELLNADKPHEASKLLIDTSMRLTRTKFKNKLVDFAHEGHAIISQELKNKKTQGDDYGMKFGWPTLDAMADGLGGGDVVTIVGRPGQGKTYAMLETASYGWLHQHKTPMLVSMEMKPLPIIQRLAAMTTKKSITQLKKAELSSKSEKQLLDMLDSFNAPGMLPFWVVDGALAATVADIIMLARLVKPDAVWIDGAYLVKSIRNITQRWDRISEILEQIKSDLAEALDIPAIISFQFNRNQKTGTSGSLDNIAYSDAVGQLSSVILGLGLADNEDSVETIKRRRVEVLKGRNGEVGEFFINWKFDEGPDYMNFSEIKAIEQGDMVYGVY